MAVTSTFTGGFRWENDVRGHKMVVDLPSNKGGTDAGPTPPELLAASLGTCVGMYALFFCQKHQIDPTGMVVSTDFAQVNDPSRIGSLSVTIELPAGIPDAQYDNFMKTVEACLVHNTLHHCPEVSITVAALAK